MSYIYQTSFKKNLINKGDNPGALVSLSQLAVFTPEKDNLTFSGLISSIVLNDDIKVGQPCNYFYHIKLSGIPNGNKSIKRMYCLFLVIFRKCSEIFGNVC